MIIPCNKLPTLYIDDSFKVVNLIEFWGTIVSKFYDQHEGVDVFTFFLFGPWGSFDYVKIVVRYVDEDDISFYVPKVQVWC